MAAMGRSWSNQPNGPTNNLNGVLGIGQSLMLGLGSTILISEQTYGTWMPAGGVRSFISEARIMPYCDWANLSLGGMPVMKPFMDNVIANALATNNYQMFASIAAIGGTNYAAMAQGTNTFNEGLSQVNAAYLAATRAGFSYVHRALICLHGEQDDFITNTSYYLNLPTWQANYQSAIQAITGQSQSVPLLLTQPSSWTAGSARTTPVTPQQMLTAMLANPTVISLIGPKYFLTYNGDGVHPVTASYVWLADYYAKAYISWVFNGVIFQGLYPLSCVRTAATITVVMSRGGLTLDTTLVTDPSGTYASRTYSQLSTSPTNTTVTNFKGFEFVDENATTPSASVTALAITTTNIANDTVTVILSGTPTSTNKRLRYAYSYTVNAVAGATTGARGNLRDSDTSFTGLSGNSTYNWCVTFDMDAS